MCSKGILHLAKSLPKIYQDSVSISISIALTYMPILKSASEVKIGTVVECSTAQNLLQSEARMLEGPIPAIMAVTILESGSI